MATTNQLARVAPAAFAEGMSAQEVRAAITDTLGINNRWKRNDKGNRIVPDGKTDLFNRTRNAYIAGRVAFRLFPDLSSDDALAKVDPIVNGISASAKSKVKEGQVRRTEEQDKAMTAARVYWSRCIADLEIAAPHGNAGNGNAEGTNKRPEESTSGASETPNVYDTMPEESGIYADKEAFDAHVLQVLIGLGQCQKKAMQKGVCSNKASTVIEDALNAAKVKLG